MLLITVVSSWGQRWHFFQWFIFHYSLLKILVVVSDSYFEIKTAP